MPLAFDIRTGNATTTAISLGAMGDSYYEYLLKVGQVQAAFVQTACIWSILCTCLCCYHYPLQLFVAALEAHRYSLGQAGKHRVCVQTRAAITHAPSAQRSTQAQCCCACRRRGS